MNHKILLVDDHPAVRRTVRHLLESEGCTVVAEADNGPDALRLARDLRPDTLVLNLGKPHRKGLATLDHLTALRLPVKIVVLTAKASSHIAMRCLQAGAHAVVNKHHDLWELLNAIRVVNEGISHFDPPALPCACIKLITKNRNMPVSTLSVRELEVLQLLAQGMSNQQMCERMKLNSNTISGCKARLLIKLNACNPLDTHGVAKQNGLLH